MRCATLVICLILSALTLGAAPPATRPAEEKLPHIQIDAKAKQVRIDCEMLGIDAPLEFFCVLNGTNEHESVLRTAAKPSDIHLALLIVGLEPGEPVRYSDAKKQWFPPHGPPLSISVEFQKDGKRVTVPAARMMKSIKDGTPMPQHPFIFAGSQLAPDGTYAADITGYVISIVNFDLTLIDVPELASNDNQQLLWKIDKEFSPPAASAVTMIIEPMDAPPNDTNGAATRPSSDAGRDATENDPQEIATLRKKWERALAPHRADLRDAAQAHYEVIAQLRREQQRLIDEADRIQRLIDDLEKQYQQLTTPQPKPEDR